MLEAINLGCVRGSRRLFRDLNFSLSPGGFLEVRGPNGGGKTSLLRILCGLATPAEGEVRWNGTNIRRLREEYSGSIAYVAHLNAVKDELTALENLFVAERVTGHQLTRAQAADALERVGLSNQRNLAARLLSAGQRRRLALARLITSQATLWIMDEMLTSLDDAGVELARDTIGTHLARGGMAVFATHQEINLTLEGAQRIQLS
ncbi:MAG TPA: cytochrome c biogenesis heme-transporting ATPase CcmA [Pyrinomonadaceae bacterium]|nr:cytochrome c biogenesis heme-transporting ATPase CcmA [Pyrinomonadaceae bacterium]